MVVLVVAHFAAIPSYLHQIVIDVYDSAHSRFRLPQHALSDFELFGLGCIHDSRTITYFGSFRTPMPATALQVNFTGTRSTFAMARDCASIRIEAGQTSSAYPSWHRHHRAYRQCTDQWDRVALAERPVSRRRLRLWLAQPLLVSASRRLSQSVGNAADLIQRPDMPQQRLRLLSLSIAGGAINHDDSRLLSPSRGTSLPPVQLLE
jgi:hypothetical protein